MLQQLTIDKDAYSQGGETFADELVEAAAEQFKLYVDDVAYSIPDQVYDWAYEVIDVDEGLEESLSDEP